MEVGNRSPYIALEPTAGLQPAAAGATVSAAADGRVSRSVITAQAVTVADSSQLSSAARIAGEAAQLPEVREDRVASLQQQIASGSYQVEPHEVADALVRQFRG